MRTGLSMTANETGPCRAIHCDCKTYAAEGGYVIGGYQQCRFCHHTEPVHRARTETKQVRRGN